MREKSNGNSLNSHWDFKASGEITGNKLIFLVEKFCTKELEIRYGIPNVL